MVDGYSLDIMEIRYTLMRSLHCVGFTIRVIIIVISMQ